MISLMRHSMNSKNIFLWPVVISIIGHGGLIAVSSVVDLRDNAKATEFMTVQISQPQTAAEPEINDSTAQEKKPQQAEEAKPVTEDGREDTVDISSSDVKYAAYLADVKKKIMRIWKYPADAYVRNEEGDVVIQISIDANGSLHHAELINSSGSNHLDSGTLGVFKAAAPFSPLPLQYELSRLNIIASFRYRMKD